MPRLTAKKENHNITVWHLGADEEKVAYKGIINHGIKQNSSWTEWLWQKIYQYGDHRWPAHSEKHKCLAAGLKGTMNTFQFPTPGYIWKWIKNRHNWYYSWDGSYINASSFSLFKCIILLLIYGVWIKSRKFVRETGYLSWKQNPPKFQECSVAA